MLLFCQMIVAKKQLKALLVIHRSYQESMYKKGGVSGKDLHKKKIS